MRAVSRQDGTDDNMLFSHIISHLDEGEAACVKVMLNDNPITFKEYWNQLCFQKEKISGKL